MTTTPTSPANNVGSLSGQNLANITDPSQFTNVTWAALVLILAGDPVTQNNVDNMLSWMVHENGNGTWTGTAGANNPLNNGLGSGGGDGTGSYPDLATAAVYAAKGIEGGIFSTTCGGNAPGGIQAALKADAPFAVFKQAVIKSGWASGCYSSWTETSPDSVQTVSVAAAASHSSTHNPSIGSVSSSILNATSTLQNVEASANQLTGGAAGAIGSAIGGISGVEQGASDVLSHITSASWWLRVGMGALGIALFGIGLAGFISTTKPGSTAKSDGITDAAKGAATDAAMAAIVA